MKILRCLDAAGAPHLAVIDQEGVARRISGHIFSRWTATSEIVEVAKILPPVVPAQILCIGLNYRRHAMETGAKIPTHPVLFIKNIASVLSPGDAIQLPTHLASAQVDYECELAVVIGRECKNVGRAEALDYVLGYTCANDVSAREWQKNFGGSQWCRGKSFDTFCPLGPWLVTPEEIPNPNALGIRTFVNGETLQESNTSDMIFDVPALIEFLSGSTTLPAGTVILTGTPSGVGMARNPPRWLQAGDEVTIEIDGIGRLTNPVILEPKS